ncbi:protein transport protein Sec24C-like [Nilaparvata lugens]|uniref:protein transport protein Sec24C-like n=1 Tax=Nilaparvata lugens TaxID=108931 RepID=UPI00193E3B4F|nr:protein transport protein Sec24C-like [Nilaparvata lugens]
MPPPPLQQQQQQMPPPPLQQQQQMPPQQQQQLYQQQQQQKQFMPPQYNGMPPPGQAAPRGSGMPPLPQPGNLQRSMPPPAAGKFQPMGFQSPYNAQGGHLPQQAPPSMGGMPPPGMGQGAPGMPPPLNQGYYQGEQPQPGYPAQQPGYPAQQPGYPPGYPSPLGQANQAKRLDPDQMPSPIQVMQEDRKTKSGIFTTNLKGQPPPLVTTDFTVNDQGNASPRFIRSTMYNIPTTVDVMKQTSVPFGLVISPFARLASNELPPPIVNMGEIGPVRCVRCKAYMSPFMQFIDGGRRFHCLLCKGTTEVPPEYFQHLDHTGERVDKFSSPELLLGAYEYVATKEYCRDNTFPKPPALIFMIDVSYNNMKSGMVSLLCSRMKEIIRLLPKDEGMPRSNMRVGFVTYNNTVHFYNLKACLAQPQMMVVGDVNDMFMPLLDGFLVDPIESEMVIDQLMEQIPRMFADTRETETILAPAIQAGLEALKAAECAGKLLMFHSSLPIAEAPGKLKNRDDRKMLGTDKEKTVLAPQNNVYNNLGQDCVGAACSVDLFIFNNSYIDLATVGQICRLTGGEIFKYTYFQADLDGDRLIEDIKHDVSRPIAFDAVMRVRTSTGIRPTDFYGHFFMSNTTDMELASIDCDKAVALEIKHDDKLTEEEGVFIQTALLYTSCSGQRRVRILNLSLSTCVQMVDLYRACELDTVINFFAKQSVFRLLEHTPKQVKDSLISRSAALLACYRKNCASPSSSGQLILPECMKLLPLYISCLIKSDAISGGSDMTIDDRSFVMQAVSIMDVPSSVVYFYPRLMSVHDLDPNSDEIPPSIRCSYEKFREDGAYILENGIHLFLWLGLNLSNEWVQGVFAAHSVAQVDTDKSCIPYLDTPISRRMHNLIETIRSQRHRYMRLTIVRQRDKLEIVVKHFLMEDRGTDGSSSYVDFLCHMHKEIRSLLS